MSKWIALGPVSGGFHACAMDGAALVSSVTASDEKTALDGMENAPVFRIGDGPPDKLPASILPQAGVSHLGGLEQDKPADLMSAWVRLWIAGFLAQNDDWDGVVCAVHSDLTHWVHISAGEAVSVQSSLTLRLMASLGGAETAAQSALEDTIARPERLASHLRTAELSGDAEAITGHLIGAELAATRPYWLGQQVAVIAENPELYACSLRAQSVPVKFASPGNMIIPGLAAFAKALGFAD